MQGKERKQFIQKVEGLSQELQKKGYLYIFYNCSLVLRAFQYDDVKFNEQDQKVANLNSLYKIADIIHNLPLFLVKDLEGFDTDKFWGSIRDEDIFEWLKYAFMSAIRTESNSKMSSSKFHVKPIERGVYGELSKIKEELEEAYDAEEQGQDLMLLIELSDMVGAVEGVAKKYGFTLDQLIAFATLRSQVAIEEE